MIRDRSAGNRDKTRRLQFLAPVSLVALVLGACSPTGADSTGNDGSGKSDQSPLEKYLGDSGPMLDGGGGMEFVISARGPGESDADRQKQRRVEEEVAACMRKEGFEYIPVSPDESEGPEEFDDAFSLDPDEFAKRYGYGIATLGPAGPDAEEEDADDNPNTEIRKALSPAAKKAYDKALWGDDASPGGGVIVSGPEDGEASETVPMGLGGCMGKVTEKVFGKPDEALGFDFAEFESLFEDITSLRERIERDPRAVEAIRGWADCMADAGYGDFEHPDAAQESVMDRMSELYGFDQAGGGEQSGEAGPAEADPEKLAELRDYELAVAKADYGCREGEYEKAYRDVSYELEKEFVEQHRTELERYRDAMAKLGEGN